MMNDDLQHHSPFINWNWNNNWTVIIEWLLLKVSHKDFLSKRTTHCPIYSSHGDEKKIFQSKTLCVMFKVCGFYSLSLFKRFCRKGLNWGPIKFQYCRCTFEETKKKSQKQIFSPIYYVCALRKQPLLLPLASSFGRDPPITPLGLISARKPLFHCTTHGLKLMPHLNRKHAVAPHKH